MPLECVLCVKVQATKGECFLYSKYSTSHVTVVVALAQDPARDLKNFADQDCRKIWNEVKPLGPHMGWRNIVPM